MFGVAKLRGLVAISDCVQLSLMPLNAFRAPSLFFRAHSTNKVPLEYLAAAPPVRSVWFSNLRLRCCLLGETVFALPHCRFERSDLGAVAVHSPRIGKAPERRSSAIHSLLG